MKRGGTDEATDEQVASDVMLAGGLVSMVATDDGEVVATIDDSAFEGNYAAGHGGAALGRRALLRCHAVLAVLVSAALARVAYQRLAGDLDPRRTYATALLLCGGLARWFEVSYLLAAVVYFVMCYALSYLVKRLHKKIAIIR